MRKVIWIVVGFFVFLFILGTLFPQKHAAKTASLVKPTTTTTIKKTTTTAAKLTTTTETPDTTPYVITALDQSGEGSATTQTFQIYGGDAWKLDYSFDCSNLGAGHADLFQLETYQSTKKTSVGGLILGRHVGGGVIVSSGVNNVQENILTSTGLSSSDAFAKADSSNDRTYFLDVNSLCKWHLLATDTLE